MRPFTESNDIFGDSAALRRRADRDGYLFLRDLVDKEAILATRRDITGILKAVGWIDDGADPVEAVTTHPALIEGLPNRSGNRLRLSVDYRYQRAADPVMEKVLTPHQGRLSWEEVYKGWKSDRYQYHWQKFDLTPVPKAPVQIRESI